MKSHLRFEVENIQAAIKLCMQTFYKLHAWRRMAQGTQAEFQSSLLASNKRQYQRDQKDAWRLSSYRLIRRLYSDQEIHVSGPGLGLLPCYCSPGGFAWCAAEQTS